MMFNPEEEQPGGFGGFGQLAPQLAQQFQRPPAPQFDSGGGGSNPGFLARIKDLVSGQMRQPNTGQGLGGQAARLRERIGGSQWPQPRNTGVTGGWQPDFRQVAGQMAGPRRMPRQRFNEGQGQGY